MNKIKVEIASVPDRENLVAEIWYNESLIAEVNLEQKDLNIEFYTSHGQVLPFDELLEALIKAKDNLTRNS
jgi:hypothetical protein